MKIYKETKIKNPLYVTILENGATLFVYDGYGEDYEGRKYLPVIQENTEGDSELVGWREA